MKLMKASFKNFAIFTGRSENVFFHETEKN